MTTTTLDPQLLQAASLVTAFKHDEITRVMAAMIHMGIVARDFDASMLPEGIAQGERADKLPGLAVAQLRQLGILTVTDNYRKSTKASAKGRPVRVLMIRSEEVGLARAWLRKNGFSDPTADGQFELFAKEDAA